ncbi:hypothetical protein E2C01_083821 [Portunus trituberculatus]|uniref:Uncharacterized protein n=1 Tax=Portunus trituberculatus TaxID=210409 RepID=A0A5B7J5U6_PORTR|nr:hypothetical protein [Portunus trituberculatus]
MISCTGVLRSNVPVPAQEWRQGIGHAIQQITHSTPDTCNILKANTPLIWRSKLSIQFPRFANNRNSLHINASGKTRTILPTNTLTHDAAVHTPNSGTSLAPSPTPQIPLNITTYIHTQRQTPRTTPTHTRIYPSETPSTTQPVLLGLLGLSMRTRAKISGMRVRTVRDMKEIASRSSSSSPAASHHRLCARLAWLSARKCNYRLQFLLPRTVNNNSPCDLPLEEDKISPPAPERNRVSL